MDKRVTQIWSQVISKFIDSKIHEARDRHVGVKKMHKVLL